MDRSSEGLYERVRPDQRADPTVSRKSARLDQVSRTALAASALVSDPVEADAANAQFTPAGTHRRAPKTERQATRRA